MSLLKRLPKNEHGRDLAVADVHGEFARLEELLSLASFDPLRDRLFIIGDLVDRGPDSDQALAWLDRPYVHALMGNHELMAIEWATMREACRADIYAHNGGTWFIGLTDEEQGEFAQAFATLPLAIEVATDAGTVGLVHAEVPPGMAWGELTQRLADGDRDLAHSLLWGRKRIQAVSSGWPAAAVPGVERIYSGHTPLKEPLELANIRMIDTGAVFGGPMVLVDIVADEVVAMQAPRVCESTH